MQSETGFRSSHQLKSYVASKSHLKLAARAVPSADAGLLVICWAVSKLRAPGWRHVGGSSAKFEIFSRQICHRWG